MWSNARDWGRAIAAGLWFGVAPLRLTDSIAGWVVTVVTILLILGLTGLGSLYAFLAPQFGPEDWKPPLDPTQVGIATLVGALLLFVVGTIRYQKRIDDLASPDQKEVLAFDLELDLKLLHGQLHMMKLFRNYQDYVDREQVILQLDLRMWRRLRSYHRGLEARYDRERLDVALDLSGMDAEKDDDKRSLAVATKVFEWKVLTKIKNVEEILEILESN